MQEYWVNVYGLNHWDSLERSNYSAIDMTVEEIIDILNRRGSNRGWKPIYRIHVKMKPKQLTGRFQRIPIREASILDGYRS